LFLRSVNCENCSTPFWYSPLMCDAFIQLRSMFPLCCHTSLSYSSCMITSLFSLKVWPYSIQEDIFIVDSYVKVYSLFLDLTKFQQHFTLISRITTWKWWHVPHPLQSSMKPKNKVKCTIPKFLQILEKRIYLYVWINYKNKSSQTVQTDNSSLNTSINPNCPY